MGALFSFSVFFSGAKTRNPRAKATSMNRKNRRGCHHRPWVKESPTMCLRQGTRNGVFFFSVCPSTNRLNRRARTKRLIILFNSRNYLTGRAGFIPIFLNNFLMRNKRGGGRWREEEKGKERRGRKEAPPRPLARLCVLCRNLWGCLLLTVDPAKHILSPLADGVNAIPRL